MSLRIDRIGSQLALCSFAVLGLAGCSHPDMVPIKTQYGTLWAPGAQEALAAALPHVDRAAMGQPGHFDLV